MCHAHAHTLTHTHTHTHEHTRAHLSKRPSRPTTTSLFWAGSSTKVCGSFSQTSSAAPLNRRTARPAMVEAGVVRASLVGANLQGSGDVRPIPRSLQNDDFRKMQARTTSSYSAQQARKLLSLAGVRDKLGTKHFAPCTPLVSPPCRRPSECNTGSAEGSRSGGGRTGRGGGSPAWRGGCGGTTRAVPPVPRCTNAQRA